MAQINESQLNDMVANLRKKMHDIENRQLDEFSAQDAGQAVGNAAGTVAGLASALPRAGIEAGQAVANKAGQWWDAAKQGASNFAGGIAQGAKQGWAATDPAKMMGGGGQSAANTGTTKPVAKPDPAVLKLQQELIAKGAKIKADGIMGPATQAAQKQFGGQAAATTGTTQPAAPNIDPNTAVKLAAQGGAAAAAPQAGGNGTWSAESVETSGTPVYSEDQALARIIQLSR
jgi:hypothetical protein